METLVSVTRHENQGFGRRKWNDCFGSYSYGYLKVISCCNFESGIGVLPSPTIGFPFSFLTRSTKNPSFRSDLTKPGRRNRPTVSPMPSPTKVSAVFNGQSRSELWAGPTYSNSPPPSSLPIPKFSLQRKRSLSLELPDSKSGFILHPETKSAPASPTGDSPMHYRDIFVNNAFATENLRRILNLDLSD